MGRIIALTFYLAPVAVGPYFNIWIHEPGGSFTALAEGSFLILFGGYLFWLDFLSLSRARRK
jgi:hypothetical protein